MKRSILAVVSIVSIGSLIGGNIHWNQKVDATTQKAKQSLNIGYSESITKSSTNVTNTESGGSSISQSNASNSKENKATETNKDKENTTNTNSANANGDKKKSVAAIKKEYNALFNELETQETSKVDQLMVQAKADYVSKKGTKTEVMAKYQAVSQQLEAQADQSFNAIYQQLQYDLEKNGYSLNEAQQFQQTYNSKKASRAKRVASEIKGF